jgi:hypothetical protein
MKIAYIDVIAKNELIEIHGMLSGNNMASYSIGHSLQLC